MILASSCDYILLEQRRMVQNMDNDVAGSIYKDLNAHHGM
jgi:hypothetical protein